MLKICLLLVGIFLVHGAGSARANCLNISDIPVETKMVSASPNIMFVLDNSGSMDWTLMTPEDDGLVEIEGQRYRYVFDDPGDNQDSGVLPRGIPRMTWKTQWCGFNKIYYNPQAEYPPWPNMTNAHTSSPRSNPVNDTPTFDLTAEYCSVSSEGTATISIKNAHYYTWDDVDGNGELGRGETVYLVNFVGGAREFYRVDDVDADYIVGPGELIETLAPPESVKPRIYNKQGKFLRYMTDAEDLQNFANWYSYYRKRELTAKAAVANVIQSLKGVQVGFYSINSGLRQTVLPVKVDMGGSIIVDNQDSGYWESGNWSESNAEGEYNNSARQTGNIGDHASWTLNLPQSGAYNVYAWWNYGSTRDTNALYTITHAGGPATVRVNQQEDFGQWTFLGRYQFDAGTSACVTVARDSQSTGSTTSADAVMFEPVGSALTDETDTLLDFLYSLDSAGGKPLRNALLAVGRYYHQNDGQTSDLGESPYASDIDGGACQQSFAIVITDGYYDGPSPGVGNQDGDQGAPYADSYPNTLADVAMKYYKEDLAPGLPDRVPANSCDDATHQHMVTYCVSFGLRGTLSPVDNDQDGKEDDPCFLNSDTPVPTWPNPQSGGQEKMDDLWHTAVNGRGAFYSALDPKELIDSLKVLFQNIVTRTGSGASVAANSEQLNTNTVLYQASYNSTNWAGDVTAYPVDPVTGQMLGEDDVLWHASDMLQDIGWNDRNIVTYNGTSEGIRFQYGSLTSDQKTALDRNWETDPTLAQNLVEYLRGREIRGFRSRTKKLGDIVHSAPLLVGNTIYSGANDGMLHAFNAENGAERFGYIPNLVFDTLRFLKDNDYEHMFYVDLTPVAVEHVGESDMTLLIGGLGKGGKGYYVLDVTDADSVNPLAYENAVAEMVLWEYPKVGTIDNDMGYTFSKAFIVQSYSTAHEWVVIFGNGYDSASGKAVLYVLDLNGNVIKKIDTGANACNGLSTPSVVDVNGDRRVDYVYAGDLKGNLWKFDLTDSDPVNWTVAFDDGTEPKPLFQAVGQPITTKPDVMGHPVGEGYIVVFGTGKFLGVDDRSNRDVQTIFGIWDYGDDDDSSEYLGSFNKATGTLSNQSENVTLLEQTEIDFRTVSGHDLRTLSDNPANWSTIDDTDAGQNPNPGSEDCEEDECMVHVGWYFDLPLKGERVISSPFIREGKVVVISFIPNTSPCTCGGDSIVLEINAATGARFLEAQFDTNEDRTIDVQDLIHIGNDWISPSGRSYPGILQAPVILKIPDQDTEVKIFSSTTGVTERLFERAEKRGLFYWLER